MSKLAAVILAAGQGTRMNSSTPKVLHHVGGVPMVLWSIQNAAALGAAPVVLVVGIGAEAVKQAVGDQVEYAHQAEQLGTGHATLQARETLLGRSDAVLVLYGDMPNLRLETLQHMITLHQRRKPAITMLSVLSDDSMGFGRVVRDAQGQVQAIVEEAVASPEILALKELNCGVYCFDAGFLWEYLPRVPVTPPKGEHYLTDMVELAVAARWPVEVFTIEDVEEVQGVNTRVHLARSERIMRQRIAEDMMLRGVTLVDPATTYIEATVSVGADTIIHPNTHLQGHTSVGERCILGPNSVIRDTVIGDDCKVLASVLEKAVLEDEVEIGPFGRLREGAHLGRGVHMGNFGEVKNSHLGAGARMGHFGYVGDTEVGENSNIGAGAITCNYDGTHKHRTIIGVESFIGSGAMLVAPVRVGARAVVGAGSVVTHDVPDDTLSYGVPARTIRQLDEKGPPDE